MMFGLRRKKNGPPRYLLGSLSVPWDRIFIRCVRPRCSFFSWGDREEDFDRVTEGRWVVHAWEGTERTGVCPLHRKELI